MLQGAVAFASDIWPGVQESELKTERGKWPFERQWLYIPRAVRKEVSASPHRLHLFTVYPLILKGDS
jgi:hypothetical protein